MVLMDIPELDKLLADVAASLTDDGLFVFSILQPSFFGQPPTRATGRKLDRVRTVVLADSDDAGDGLPTTEAQS
ncbi:MAG: hypothetical protein M3Y77_11875 [Actinomycetota bacterium]|nr:hypothetical protein [Actinomycetota bacterium]MDQ2847024.1 hypothetical protein [Actinomycetota bacterium]